MGFPVAEAVPATADAPPPAPEAAKKKKKKKAAGPSSAGKQTFNLIDLAEDGGAPGEDDGDDEEDEGDEEEEEEGDGNVGVADAKPQTKCFVLFCFVRRLFCLVGARFCVRLFLYSCHAVE